MLRRRQAYRTGFAWLELLLVLAILALFFQFFPSLWTGALWALDPRHWPRTVWFAANGAVLLVLVAIRFAPDLYHDWRAWHGRLAADHLKSQKQQELKEQREMLERMQEARKRQVF